MKKVTKDKLKQLIEAAFFVAEKPVTVKELLSTLLSEYQVTLKSVNKVIAELKLDYHGRGIELVDVASGLRFQANSDLSDDLALMWQEKPPKYSRAMLETLALIAYKQPITRGEIEDIRGVGVSSHIVKTLQEREWVKVLGHKEVPGRPALFGTTKKFLDYFNLKTLADLPELMSVEALSLLQEEHATDVSKASINIAGNAQAQNEA
jgi:segregation and condensation protein B